MSQAEKTLVGVPFYEKEGQSCLDSTLANINDCLNVLDIDASILVQLNGPETACGRAPVFTVDQSRYNAEVEFKNGCQAGQVRAIDDLTQLAQARGITKAFITDADIYRFPDAFAQMWRQADAPVVGAHYRPYPVEIVESAFGSLPPQERLLYQIFDGDQTPLVKRALQQHGVERVSRIKGSLMLLEVDTARGMHDNQNIVSDSVINSTAGRGNTQVADGAFFMHMGRVDMGDHIKARMRHYRGAAARDDLEGFLMQEVALPTEDTMDAIAETVRQTGPRGDYYAMLYLARCAVRSNVNAICLDTVLGQWDEAMLPELTPISMESVITYADADCAVSRFFVDVDWSDVQGYSQGAPAITQEKLRAPFDLAPHLTHKHLAEAVIDSLGIRNADYVLPTTAT